MSTQAALQQGDHPAATGASHHDWAAHWKRTLVGIAGILVAVPAVINAGYDIYVAAARLPRTDAERVNEAMFRKYFKKQPLAEIPVRIRHSVGEYEARFSVFDEGDVLVEHGAQTQWFPFPRPAPVPKTSGFSLLPAAHAQAASSGPAKTTPVARDKLRLQTWSGSGSSGQRTRIYEDGRVERSEIDLRSGKILHTSVTQPAGELVAPGAEQRTTRTLPALVIDLAK